MSNPHSRSEQDCMKMCLKNGVPHNGTLVWGTPMYRCGAHRFYVAECIVIMLQGVSEAGDFFLFLGGFPIPIRKACLRQSGKRNLGQSSGE